jgi:hypothetical protein
MKTKTITFTRAEIDMLAVILQIIQKNMDHGENNKDYYFSFSCNFAFCKEFNEREIFKTLLNAFDNTSLGMGV